jgi:hypothetical protein
MVMFLLEIFGWFGNMAVKNVLILAGASSDTQWIVLSLVGYVVQLTLAMNPPVLFATRFFLFH